MNKQPLRIAIITGLYAPYMTGVSVAVHQRVCWLLKQGHEVFLIHPEFNKSYPKSVGKRPMPGIEEAKIYPNFSSYAFPTKPLIFYSSLPQPLNYRAWSDTEQLQKFKPDIIIVEEAPQLRGCYSLFLQGYGKPVGVEYARKTKTPIISLFHTDIVAYIHYYVGNLALNLLRPILPMLTKQLSQAYDRNFFSSREQLTRYQALGSVKSEYLPYQGVDCDRFNPDNIRYNPIPDDNRPVMLFVGRITAEKNVTKLIDIFPHVAALVPNVRLVIIGSGPLDAELRRRAQAFPDGITIWGESHGAELLGWYARANVFVNPSVTENFCTANNEALASGTPVVAAHAPSTTEQVQEGINGYCADGNIPQDFARKIAAILNNPILQAEMSQRARQLVLEFDWNACSQKFEDKLYQILAKDPSPELANPQPADV